MTTPRKTPPDARTHQLVVAYSKCVFWHQTYGAVIATDPVPFAEAREYGLEPLLLYALSPLGTSSMWLRFSAQPLPLAAVCFEGWTSADYLRGYPDRVVVSRALAAGAARFAATLGAQGITVVAAPLRDKQHPAALRTAQDRAPFFCGLVDRLSLPPTIEGLNARAFAGARFVHDIRLADGQLGDATQVERWLSAPIRPPSAPPGAVELDWTPGDWLHAWQANAVFQHQRCFASSPDPHPGAPVFLCTGAASVIAVERLSRLRMYGKDELPDKDTVRYWNTQETPSEALRAADLLDSVETEEALSDFEDWGPGNRQYDTLATKYESECLSAVVDSWPNPPRQLAKAIGTTAKALDRHLSGKQSLDPQLLRGLHRLLGFDVAEDGYWEPRGPVVLLVQRPRAASAAWNGLSHGGDSDVALEVIPQRRPADPSYRFFLMRGCSQAFPSVFMVPRGHSVLGALDKHFINCMEEPVEIEPDVYQDLVATCARACLDPAVNVPEITAWGKRHFAFLERLESECFRG